MTQCVFAELKLLLERRVQFLEVLEINGIAGLGTDLLLGSRIEAIVHGQLDDLAEVGLPLHRVTGLIRDIASHAGPDTGASRFLQWEIADPVVVAPEVQSPLHHNVRVEELRETDAGPNHIEHFLDELARSLRSKRNRERRLGQ